MHVLMRVHTCVHVHVCCEHRDVHRHGGVGLSHNFPPRPRVPTQLRDPQGPPPLSPAPASSTGSGTSPGSGCPPRVLGVSRAVGVPRVVGAPAPPAPSPCLTREVPPVSRCSHRHVGLSQLCAARGVGTRALLPQICPRSCPHCPCCLQGLCLAHRSGQSQCIFPSPCPFLSLPSTSASSVLCPLPWHPFSNAVPSPSLTTDGILPLCPFIPSLFI